MKPILVGDKRYRITFQYPHKQSHKRNSVVCQIVLTYPIEDHTVQEIVGRGMASCNLAEDEFSKEIGRRKALTRAIVDLPKSLRTSLWENYWYR